MLWFCGIGWPYSLFKKLLLIKLKPIVILNIFFIGFGSYKSKVRDTWERLETQLEKEWPELPPPKKFKAKHNLVVLKDYALPASKDFWEKFPKNIEQPAKSLVNADKLRHLALQCGYSDIEHLNKVHMWLEQGAQIGCTGKFRLPSKSKNSKSALLDGQKVTDAICDWVEKGFVYGPVPLDQVPPGAKFSGIMTRPKPNGSVRVILNLSAPIGESVNDGISSEEFPTKMSSTEEWLRVLNKAGKNCLILKIDFSDAYKHIAVHRQDTDLQWFEWLGMAFKELCLIFGAVSSAGIFDAVAKIILFIVIKKANFDKDLCIQHLDDICCASSLANSDLLEKFDKTFAEVAKILGVQLAPRDDPTKSFGSSTKGVVLGVEYDTEKWTWGLAEEKLSRFLNCLKDAINSQWILQNQMWSIAGKIINVKALVPSGKYNIDHILRASAQSTDAAEKVIISYNLKKQLEFWSNMLPLCSGRILIPNPDACLPPWTIETYTDAAGGSWQKSWHGVGAVNSFWWAYLPWSNEINSGGDAGNGRRLNRVMSALELMGPLLVLAAGFNWCKNNCVRVWVDNMASVCIFKKGYSSSCRLSSTIVKAISSIAAAINCRVEVEKITRCSNPYAVMSDNLSKGKFKDFLSLAKEESDHIPIDMAWIPFALKEWVAAPVEDDLLGHKILLEISNYTEVFSYNC